MTFLRWALFWPVGIWCGLFISGIFLQLGDVLFGGWWFTSCLLTAAHAYVLPIATVTIGSHMAPQNNKYVHWSLLGPYCLVAIFAVFMMFALIFLGVEGGPSLGADAPRCFVTIGPWWHGFCISVGFLYGFFAVAAAVRDLDKDNQQRHIKEGNVSPDEAESPSAAA